MDVNKINILGTEYTIEIKPFDSDETFEREGLDGYCRAISKNIVVCDYHTIDCFKGESEEVIRRIFNQTLRHEILHAFLYESGLAEESYSPKTGWAVNEEMIDWFAIQYPKIHRIYKQLGIGDD